MYVMNITDYYSDFIICTDNKNEDGIIIINCLFRSKPANIIIFSLLLLVIYTLIKPLITNK